MPIPSYETLMLPVLRLAAAEETRVPQAASVIADSLKLSESERDELLPSGKQRILHNRIHWAKFYMSKAGLIESPKRGLFKATELGRQLLATNPATITTQVLKSYPAFIEFYQNDATQPKSTAEAQTITALPSMTPEEQIDTAQALLHAALRSDLLQRITDNSPMFFERVIVDLLVAMGYGGSHENAALRLGKSGDNGVDGVIDEDRLGLDRIYVQAKRYGPQNTVQRAEVQAFVGSLVGFGATKGVFVTTSNFTSGAQDYTKHLPQRVILINGARLTELMIEHDVGVRVNREISIKRLDEDFFADED